jgi:hypothetical protein
MRSCLQAVGTALLDRIPTRLPRLTALITAMTNLGAPATSRSARSS